MKRLNDAELMALSAIVYQQTELMRAENVDRERNGFACAYTMDVSGISEEADMILAEVKARAADFAAAA
jgi:hypothetical protein